jgi:cyclophilin family peptidyl-prolyl cis-trans isomerase
MANKKKIDARMEAKRRAQQTRYIQFASAGVIVLVLVLAVRFLSPEKEEPTAKQYSAYPAMTIDPTRQYFATFKMENGGEFVAQLFADKAPKTVNSFVFLAREGFYDGLTFHRVIDQFMAQGGDPTGTGAGGPGYEFEDEFDASLTFDKPGLLAMANSGPNTNGSQFFITYAPTPHLNNQHTIFGQVIEGMDVVNSLTRRDPDQAPTFDGDAMETIEITEE